MNVFPPIWNELSLTKLDTLNAQLGTTVGIPRLRVALNLILILSKQPDLKSAQEKEIKDRHISLRAKEKNEDHQRQWVEYNGNRYLAGFKYGPFRDDPRKNSKALDEEVYGLTLALQEAAKLPDLHAMRNPGFFPVSGELCYGILFEPPRNATQPEVAKSLAGHISATPQALKADLSQRVELAKSLAHYIHRLHTLDWLHKSFRCDNILLFEEYETAGKPQKGVSWDSPYVLGYELSCGEGQVRTKGPWRRSGVSGSINIHLDLEMKSPNIPGSTISTVSESSFWKSGEWSFCRTMKKFHR
ncbi:hypothetical protein BDV33DRAFT_185572 [Aspergillus novoparasiticus]|uniref:Protein kinase domain-containing protein n=1 Tax=Aspergillus novoparasiticus TaxID=986946 RepID=A0A5N6E646_9EURO|nr:hypothetical protein BDV33DRAFT_185572 [Aspergillus novoparasiticus]